MKKKLVVLIGPTAVGKTALSIELANFLNTEIVSADSRQFYKELNIGVATPSLEELSMAKHNLIGHISIQQKYNISDFEQDALKELERIFQENDYAVLTGGSGLYVNALCYGVDNMPDVKPEIREELYRDMILKLQKYNIPFSISDNDMRKYTCGKCCCGDCLIKKSTNFDVTNMLYTNGEYDKFDVLNALNEYKYGKVKGLFTSNRQKDVYTVEDLINKNFDKKTNPISPKFQYKNSNK